MTIAQKAIELFQDEIYEEWQDLENDIENEFDIQTMLEHPEGKTLVFTDGSSAYLYFYKAILIERPTL